MWKKFDYYVTECQKKSMADTKNRRKTLIKSIHHILTNKKSFAKLSIQMKYTRRHTFSIVIFIVVALSPLLVSLAISVIVDLSPLYLFLPLCNSIPRQPLYYDNKNIT